MTSRLENFGCKLTCVVDRLMDVKWAKEVLADLGVSETAKDNAKQYALDCLAAMKKVISHLSAAN